MREHYSWYWQQARGMEHPTFSTWRRSWGYFLPRPWSTGTGWQGEGMSYQQTKGKPKSQR